MISVRLAPNGASLKADKTRLARAIDPTGVADGTWLPPDLFRYSELLCR